MNGLFKEEEYADGADDGSERGHDIPIRHVGNENTEVKISSI